MLKRIFLFIAVNILVVATISVLLDLLHVQPYLSRNHLDLGQLAIFCLVWGMAGSFITLALSRMLAKWGMGVRVIDPQRASEGELALVEMVHRFARQAGIEKMPEVGIWDSPEPNAFATGPTKNRALVAFSTGLLARMDRDEVEGVAGHEVAHIANGDMVTMTLIQGVVNALVMFLARLVAYAITRGDKDSRGTRALITIAFQVVFGLLGAMVVAWFSRQREFRADAGSAKWAGAERMIGALESLQRSVDVVDPRAPASMAALKISTKSGILKLFSTHPPLEERIARLREEGAGRRAA